jgi:hypothetical protein
MYILERAPKFTFFCFEFKGTVTRGEENLHKNFNSKRVLSVGGNLQENLHCYYFVIYY